jgi:hypothetical protein
MRPSQKWGCESTRNWKLIQICIPASIGDAMALDIGIWVHMMTTTTEGTSRDAAIMVEMYCTYGKQLGSESGTIWVL